MVMDDPDEPRVLATGSHGSYRWLVSEHRLGEFLEIYPAAIVGKFIAVNSFDSGPLALSDQERSAGWSSIHDIACSPRVQSVAGLPNDIYDEWYVFSDRPNLENVHRFEGNIFDPPVKPGQLADFVSYHLSLHGETSGLTDLFWRQMEWFCPESYVSDSDFLTFVSRDHALFASVLEALSKNSS